MSEQLAEVIPAEQLTEVQDEVVSINDFKLSQPTESTPSAKEEGSKPVEPTVVKQAEPVVPSTEQPVVKESRDYSFADPAHVQLFKKMSNEAFNHFKKLYEEHKKSADEIKKYQEESTKYKTDLELAKSQPPKSSIDNPEAYRLDKEYLEAVNTYNRAESELSFWTSQYEAIRQGKNWKDYEQQGDKWVIVDREPTAAAEAEVLRNITTCQNVSREQQVKAQSVASGYTGKFNNVVKTLRATEDKFFPQFKDQAAYAANASVKAMSEQLDQLGQLGNPLAPTVCKLYAYIVQLESQQKKPTEQTPPPKPPPSSASVSGSSTEVAKKPTAPSDEDLVRFDDFKKAMSGND